MSTFITRELAGWGRFPVHNCRVARPEKRRDLGVAAACESVPDVLARGLGRAYGDAALNDGSGVILTEKLDRFLNFSSGSELVEDETGFMTARWATLEAEAGVSFAQIAETFVPRGWFLPVVPGTKWITLGGAIACDVHGKNQHLPICGTISNSLHSFELLAASGEILQCSREENAEIFWATIGGMGLTGIITTAKIHLMPIETAYISTYYQRQNDLAATLEELTTANHSNYCVAWIDCLASGKNLGRSVVIRGYHASVEDLKNAGIEENPLALVPSKTKSVPLEFPDFALNSLSVKAFNEFYYRAHNDQHKIEPFESFFWPLDAVKNWNKIYGARGFVQYQCVLPTENALEGFTRILEKISSSGRAAFLAVLKPHSAQNAAPLSFPLEGYSLALDLPNAPGIVEFCRELDELTTQFGGRVYLAKDSTTTPAMVRKMYPRLGEFEATKAKIDPHARFQSSLSRRLGIGGNQ